MVKFMADESVDRLVKSCVELAGNVLSVSVSFSQAKRGSSTCATVMQPQCR